MIIQKRIRGQHDIQTKGRDMPLKYLNDNFSDGKKYRILDIGAGASSWSMEWVTHIVDLFVEPQDKKKYENSDIKIFEFDIDDTVNWKVVLDDVKKNGKYDFVICSHTLEDINFPKGTCAIINKIGKSGYIALPSKYSEFCAHENKSNFGFPYKGYHHHRWVHQIKNNVLIGYPKMNFFEYVQLNNFDFARSINSEIEFIWKDSFDYEFLHPCEMLDNKVGPPRIHQLCEDDDLII